MRSHVQPESWNRRLVGRPVAGAALGAPRPASPRRPHQTSAAPSSLSCGPGDRHRLRAPVPGADQGAGPGLPGSLSVL